MTTPREKFQKLLRELFQFDCADLDFGIYRIMNHKRAVIEQFIEKDLLNAVSEELKKGALAQEANAAERLAELGAQINDTLGADALDVEGNLSPTYSGTKIGKEYLSLQQSAGQAKNQTELESQIFNHLYAFFSRYYDQGDFMSLRRYSKREKYAIPYNGEEVYLHWANSDQYYIKTGENFTDYSYKHGNWTVRFKLRNANVEQNNVKGAKRFFIPKVDALDLNVANHELTLPFQYRPLVSGEEARFGRTKIQETILAEALPHILDAAKSELDALAALVHEKRRDTENNPVGLLEHHLRTYTQKNTRDFFIHKDLKGLLERELDFYLKNEVLNLDELGSTGEKRSERWFQLLSTIKEIGRKIIAFVSQIENLQKHLFEKQKFVFDVNFCVTLDLIPESLYSEILMNRAQVKEWEELFAIGEVKGSLHQIEYSDQITIEFLRENPFLVVDTRLFDNRFMDALLAGFEDIDESLDGVCVRSENLHALRLLHNRYRKQVQSIYIDPPYNSDAGPISYKNGYRHSSWAALIHDRLNVASAFLRSSGIFCITIDDYEVHLLRQICAHTLSHLENLGVVAIKNNPAGRSATVGFSICHEYALFFGDPEQAEVNRLEHSESQKMRYKERDDIGFFEWTNFRKHGGVNTYRDTRPRQFYPIYVEGQAIRLPAMTWDNQRREWIILEEPKKNEEVVFPIDKSGKERIWDFVAETAKRNLNHFKVRKDSTGETGIYRKWRINDAGLLPQTWWDKSEYSAPEYGTNLLTKLFGTTHEFMFPKSVHAVADCLKVSGLRNDSTAMALDFFAGSGTTGHAIIDLNRRDGGSRKYILIEAADYFDSVLMKRLKKVVYSSDWRDGKPNSRNGTTQFIKYFNLESYEDALDNISFQTPNGQGLLSLEDYRLNYALAFETKHSHTLLNVSKLDTPFDYKLHRHGADEPLAVDLAETFNYLIGLHVRTRRVYENRGTRYLVYRGKSKERETVVIWRTTRGWGQKEFEADFKFIEKEKLTEGAEDIFVNTSSFVPGAQSLDPVFKRLMFNEE